MKTGAKLKNRQGGAVAIMVGVSMVMLIGFLALVIDLGHLYLARAGLQNAADAAALAGAKELKGDLAGINNAVAQAKATATQNTFLENLGQTSITITDANIFFSNQPYPASWLTVSEAQANPASLFFIKVETGQRDLDTWFAPIWNILHTNTFGMAVAGQSTAKITPLAICAIDVRQCTCLPGESDCGQGSLQCGYEAGKAYHLVGDINPIGPGTPIWIDAVATSAATCESMSTHDSRPFVCKGEAHVSTAPGDYVYTNTGWSTPLAKALDSRFGDYAPSGKCDPATAPPDSNIQEYAYQLFEDVAPLISGKNPYKNQTLIPDWLTPMPNPGGVYPQTAGCFPTGTDQYEASIYNCPWSPNGVYWAAASSVAAVSGVVANSNYPTSGTPYSQTSGSYFRDGGSGSLAGRRLINLMVVQCAAAGGVCRPARNRMVGQFLLQTRAAVANDVNLEFVRTVSQQEIAGQIRLFQ